MTRILGPLLASVRVRVTAAALLAVACALGASAAIVEGSLQHDRQHILLSTAQEQAREVVAINPQLTTPLNLPTGTNINSGLIQVLRNGKVVGASRALRQMPPLWYPGEPQVTSSSDIVAGLAKDVHVVAVPITVAKKITATVVVVTSLDQYDHSVAFVGQLLEIGMPVLLLVVGLIGWMIVGRALRPIEMMRREVSEVATTRRSHRVAEPATDDEVGRLARTLNSMLDRIESSSERERRFVSDASHELRSPIANIRTELEVALHRPAQADWPAVAGEVLSQNERMGTLVEELLLLARSDEGSLIGASVPTDMAAVVATVVAGDHGAAGAPVVEVRCRPATVVVPVAYLERIVSNLVDNACRYAATRVELSTGIEGEFAVLMVRDDGPGVPEAERTRIFERFVRLDESRDRGDGGFGLGLAIVSDLCRHYAGTIEVSAGDPGAVFTLRFPACSMDTPAEPPVTRVGAARSARVG